MNDDICDLLQNTIDTLNHCLSAIEDNDTIDFSSLKLNVTAIEEKAVNLEEAVDEATS